METPSTAETLDIIAHMVKRGSLRPLPPEYQRAVEIMKRDLFPKMGLSVPNIPMYLASPGLLDWAVSASTKFSSEGPPSAKRPLAIVLNGRSLDIDDPITNVATLAHEMVHAAIPYDADPIDGAFAGHGPVFTHYIRQMGLAGDPRASVPGPRFVEWFKRNIVPLAGVGTGPMTAEEVMDKQRAFPW